MDSDYFIDLLYPIYVCVRQLLLHIKMLLGFLVIQISLRTYVFKYVLFLDPNFRLSLFVFLALSLRLRSAEA